MSWRVLYVRPRSEKKIAEYFILHKVNHYLPLREESKVYQRRKVKVHKPVFPGYIFSDYAAEDRVLVLNSHMIVRILEIDNQAAFLASLEQIRMALGVDPTLGACAAFSAGRGVRIVGGPFRGIEGVVKVLRGGGTRVILNVEMIGQAVAVEVEREYLELVE